jgi:hypothetical protein
MKKSMGALVILFILYISVAVAGPELEGEIGALYKCAFPLADTDVNLDGKISEPGSRMIRLLQTLVSDGRTTPSRFTLTAEMRRQELMMPMTFSWAW